MFTDHPAAPWLLVTTFFAVVIGLIALAATVPLIAVVVAAIIAVPLWVAYVRMGGAR